MDTEESKTLKKIHQAAMEEFLQKGFRGASLRNMVKTAGVTTGAFYGYYKSKEELYDAMVGKQAQYMIGLFTNTQIKFTELSKEEQTKHMGDFGGDCMLEMFDYAYEHQEAVRLLITASEGTKYENFIHELVELEVKSTRDFVEVLEELGQNPPKIDSDLEHMIVSGMFSSFFELLLHNIPKETGKYQLKQLNAFYTAGWKEVMGL